MSAPRTVTFEVTPGDRILMKFSGPDGREFAMFAEGYDIGDRDGDVVRRLWRSFESTWKHNYGMSRAPAPRVPN